MQHAFLSGFGHYYPEEVITNQWLIDNLNTSEEWIHSRIGIDERRRAPDEVNTSDLGVKATERALEDAGWKPADLDLLVCATSTPDTLIPPTASFICQKLGIRPTVAFDVNAACSGFVYGISVAEAMMQARGFRRVAVVTAEKYTRVTDYEDRASAVFFGDSAATVLMQPEKPKEGMEIVDFHMKNFNDGAHLVTTPIGGHFRQEGNKVKDYALEAFHESATKTLSNNQLEISDLRAFMGHQANLRVLEAVGGRLGVRDDQHWHNVEYLGNQGAAGAATTFAIGVEKYRKEFQTGDHFLCTVFGSGFTSGSVLFRWTGSANSSSA